jgi:hypothetical protein
MTPGHAASESHATLVRFGRALRAEGLPVGPDRVTELCRAAALLPGEDLYWAGRATVVSRPEQIPVYNAVFGRFFGPPVPTSGPPLRVRVEMETEESVGLASSCARRASRAARGRSSRSSPS